MAAGLMLGAPVARQDQAREDPRYRRPTPPASRRARLDARCIRCGHRQQLDPAILLARYGDLDMAALRARLLYVACGGRHPELLRSWAPPPT